MTGAALLGGSPESLRRIAQHFETIGQKYLDDAKAYRAKADELEAPAALAKLNPRMILGLRYARWNEEDREIVAEARRTQELRSFKITLRALEHRGLIDWHEVPTTLGAAVLALLDDQKKDA